MSTQPTAPETERVTTEINFTMFNREAKPLPTPPTAQEMVDGIRDILDQLNEAIGVAHEMGLTVHIVVEDPQDTPIVLAHVLQFIEPTPRDDSEDEE